MASGRKNRRNSAFNLAFLDVMSCGFGAAVLLFLIIKHGAAQSLSNDSEVARLEADITARQAEIVSIDETISAMQSQADEQKTRISSLNASIERVLGEAQAVQEATAAVSGRIEEAKKALSAMEATVVKAEQDSAIQIAGQSSQQFLTGLSVEGRRIVIMVDHSASMLDQKIVNIVRRRAIGGETASDAPKWQRTQKIARWLVNKLPENSMVRFVSFSETAQTIPENRWLSVSDTAQITDALEKTLGEAPNGGTNLYRAFGALNQLSPAPDAVYLITDGLPTMGRRAARRATVSGKERLDLFNEAVKSVRVEARMNVILLPLEGDPDAAFAFWQLAHATGGRMLSPAEKWP